MKSSTLDQSNSASLCSAYIFLGNCRKGLLLFVAQSLNQNFNFNKHKR